MSTKILQIIFLVSSLKAVFLFLEGRGIKKQTLHQQGLSSIENHKILLRGFTTMMQRYLFFLLKQISDL
jgi:hypothetical protein